MSRWTMAGYLLAVWTAAPLFAQRQAVEEGWAHGREAMEAYHAQDYAGFRDHVEQALAVRPNHPGLLYQLAAAYALTGAADDALTVLERYAAMGLVAGIDEESAFDPVRETERFAAVRTRMEANAEPVGEGTVALRLTDPAFIPEGLAYDPDTGAFFIGSVHERQIVRIDREGAVAPFATQEDGLWSVLGLAFDAERRRLFAGTAAMAQTRGVRPDERGRSVVMQFDVDDGTLVRVHTLPAAEGEHVLGDLVLDADGTLLATDAVSGGIYRVDPDEEEMTVVVPPETLVSPQGLCFLGSARQLVVADYAIGLLRVDPATSEVTVVAPGPSVTVLGIDGLACYGKELIAVQNGVRPNRVLRLTLNDGATSVEEAVVLAANHPLFEEPTLGIVAGDTYYVVANSQWNRFGEDGSLPPAEDLVPPVILAFSLE